MCAMTFWVDWYLYQAFTINIKGARAILVKKIHFILFCSESEQYSLDGFAQKDYFTT